MTPNKKQLREVGESMIIQVIDELISQRTEKRLHHDDAFYYKMKERKSQKKDRAALCLNSDMFVSTTDAPEQMTYRQMGYKAVIMNISDLVVKGVKPDGIIISLGLPNSLPVVNFKSIINGIIDGSIRFDIDYIGGDINQTKEVVINPTVFGFQEDRKIIHRKPITGGDILVANGKFGLTGVGFDILLNKVKGDKTDFQAFTKYRKSINSVLSPQIGLEGLKIAENQLAKASIDSSDGLIRSLRELIRSNPGKGFEIRIDESLIDEEATRYSKEFDLPIEKLIFTEGGEEFIHLFIMELDSFKRAQKLLREKENILVQVGKVINENEIFGLKGNEKFRLQGKGYEHFS